MAACPVRRNQSSTKGKALPGKHGKHADRRLLSSSRALLLGGIAIAAVLAGTMAGVLALAPASSDSQSGLIAAPAGGRAQDRAARGDDRAAAPAATPPPASATPAPPPTAKPSSKPPKPPSGAGSVAASGTCEASFYTDDGNRTANGEIFRVTEFTAAHKSLPFNTRVRVTNTANNKSVVVRINDRGPFIAGRCLDLTPAAFDTIARRNAGVANVRFEVLQS